MEPLGFGAGILGAMPLAERFQDRGDGSAALGVRLPRMMAAPPKVVPTAG